VHLPPLTPEFLPGLDIYARRFFEQLFGGHAEPFVVVLDNVHEVPADAALAGVLLAALLDSLPVSGTLLCLSRKNMPPPLVRWSTQPGYRQLRWEDVSLTQEEAVALAKLAGHDEPEVAARCNRWVRGWVAGLKLLLRATPEELHRVVSLGDVAVQELFDYYAQEVFERVPPELRDFLLRAAVLSDIDGETAAALTEREDAALVLSKLHEERLFVERRLLPGGTSYQFHPLFHNFLRSRLSASHTRAGIAAMKSRAAIALEKRGQLESATALALDCDDPGILVRLILAQAPQMVARGRLATLENWLRAVPEPIRAGDGWLLYWLGASCSIRDLELGRATLERAYSQFKLAQDEVGAWLSIATIIQNHLMAWGSAPGEIIWQWVDVFERMRAQNGGSIPAAIETEVFSLLCHFASHCPEHALSHHMVQRALVLTQHIPDPELRLAIGGVAVGYLTWRGDEVGAWALLEQLGPGQGGDARTTIASLTFDVWRGVLSWTRSEHDRCYAVLTEARVRYREAGLGFFDYLFAIQLVLGALSAGDWAMARRAMQESLASLHPFQVALFQAAHALQAMQLALDGQTAAGAALARKVMVAASLTMSPSTVAMERTCLVSALLEAGALDEATECAAQALEAGSRLPSDRWLFDAHMLFAGIELERGDEEALLDHLRKALALAAARNFLGGVGLFQGRRAARLLALALREGIEPEYVRRLIRHRKLSAPADEEGGELWPVKLRVRALGQFALSIDEKPLTRAQQATRKPLEVLKALIGLGPSSLATLGATLWPELDGAAAHNACHVAIHRLRKILGDESAIHINQGMVALSGADAWIDVEAFRRLASRIRTALTAEPAPQELGRLIAQLLTAYPGHFLPEEEHSWAIGVREQLRARFMHLAIDLSNALLRCGAAEASISLNRHCIALDPLMESFHRGLITGLISLGRKAEALEAFRHCRAALMAGLRVEPSEETYALQGRIRRL